MIIIISPSKTLDYKKTSHLKNYTLPRLLNDSGELMKELRKLSPAGIASLMDVSRKLANENFERFANWNPDFKPENSKQAIMAFKGDVYEGLQAETFNEKDIEFAQKHLRILSGLYGVLRPLDLMQAYRLEMGLKFRNKRGKDLYEFWGDTLADYLNKDLTQLKTKTLINLASQEYFKSVSTDKLDAKVITPVFKEDKPGGPKVIALFAKKARGLMSNFIIRNKIEEPLEIKAFHESAYQYDDKLSTDQEWVFIR
jgi:uncharacterized protein